MKRKFIYLLIGIITTALLGFVAIQLYWIDNAVTLKEEEFKREIKSVLLTVVTKLEKIETAKRIKEHKKEREIYQKKARKLQESLNEFNYDTSSVYEKDGIQYKVRESRKNTLSGTQYQQSVQTLSPNGQVEVQFSFGAQGGQGLKIDSPMDDSVYNYLEQQKTALIGDVLESLNEANKFRSIAERINQLELDSLLKTELKSRGINTKFQYVS